jgi:hypothetical protein
MNLKPNHPNLTYGIILLIKKDLLKIYVLDLGLLCKVNFAY